MKRKILSLLLAISMSITGILSLPFTQGMSIKAEAKTTQPEGNPWNDTNILGNLPAAVPEVRDDFYTSCNYGWIAANTSVPEGMNKYGVREELAAENKERLLLLIQNQDSAESVLVNELFTAAMDADVRNAAGITPILPYIDEIRSIRTLDELTDYLCTDQFHPWNFLVDLEGTADFLDTSQYMVKIGLYLGDNDIVSEPDASDSVMAPLMLRAGIPQNEVTAMNIAASRITGELLAAFENPMKSAYLYENMEELIKNARSITEIKALCHSFPLGRMLESQGLGNMERYVPYSFAYLRQLDTIYTQENLEGLKGILIHSVLENFAPYLDAAAMESISGEGSFSKEEAFQICETWLSEPMQKIYADHYMTPEIKEDVLMLVKDIQRVFGKRIMAADWLSEAVRAQAVEKLNSIYIRIGSGDKWRDYSALDLNPGGNTISLADMILRIMQYQYLLAQEEYKKVPDKGYWLEESTSVYGVGAFYYPTDNSINIPAGVLDGVFYNSTGSVEERYFAVGTIIGHELTHSLDPSGSHFDKDGNLKDWWSEEDRKAYTSRQRQVEEFFGSIEVKPGEFVDGKKTIGETVADIGGMALLLDVLKEKGAMDYETAFRVYASLWPEVESSEYATLLLQNDEHPPKYLRVNAVVQQFQEFYDTFQIQEGDGMYLAPEKRVGIW